MVIPETDAGALNPKMQLETYPEFLMPIPLEASTIPVAWSMDKVEFFPSSDKTYPLEIGSLENVLFSASIVAFGKFKFVNVAVSALSLPKVPAASSDNTTTSPVACSTVITMRLSPYTNSYPFDIGFLLKRLSEAFKRAFGRTKPSKVAIFARKSFRSAGNCAETTSKLSSVDFKAVSLPI